jgi:hypothetical protein
MLSAVLSYLVPAALVFVVIARIARSRGYLLLVPIVYEFGRAAYLNTYGLSVAGLDAEQVGVVILVICALTLFVLRPPAKSKRLFSFGLVLAAGYALWVVLAAGLSFLGGMEFGKAVLAALYSMALPVSVAAWLLALSRVSEDELLGTVRVVVGMTVALCVLYIIQAVGGQTYPYAPYLTQFAQGGLTVTVRDFLTFPYFAVPLTLAWAVCSRGRALPRVLAAAICLTAVVATFTVSIVVAALVVILVAAVAARWERSPLERRRFPVMTLSVVIAVGLAVLLALAQFWVARVGGSGLGADLSARVTAILSSIRTTSWVDALTGWGYAVPIPAFWGVVLGDSLWIGLVYQLGLAGVLLLLGAIVGASIDGMRATAGASESRLILGCIAAAVPLATLIQTMTGVPSALHLGFALALGPALALGLVPQRVGVEIAHVDVSTLLPDRLQAQRWRAALLVLGVLAMLAVEVWIGMRLAG